MTCLMPRNVSKIERFLLGVEPLFETGAHPRLVEGQPEYAFGPRAHALSGKVGGTPPADDAAVRARRHDLVPERDLLLPLDRLRPRFADHDAAAQLAPERTPLVDGVLGEEIGRGLRVAFLPRPSVRVQPVREAREHGLNLCQATAPTVSSDVWRAISQFAAIAFAA